MPVGHFFLIDVFIQDEFVTYIALTEEHFDDFTERPISKFNPNIFTRLERQ